LGEELVRKRGDFNGQVVFGFYPPQVAASHPAGSWYGMRVDLYSINTVLTDEDGHLWYILRFHDHAHSPAFRLRTNGYGLDLYREHPDVARGYIGPIRHEVDAERHLTVSTYAAPGNLPERGNLPESRQAVPDKQPLHLARWVDRMEWREGDLFSLTGVQVCPVMSFVAPDAKGGWGWDSNIFRLEGTVLGRKVKGFCEYGIGWAGPGVSYMDSYRKACLHWHFLCNQYEDGTYDLAHIGYMQGEMQFAMIADENGPVMATRDLKLQVELDEGGNLARYPKVIHLELGGVKWQWNHADDSKVKHPPIPGSASREGYAQRVGDTRKLAYGWGWLNTTGDARIDPHVINKR
jgi:hypothetical protein